MPLPRWKREQNTRRQKRLTVFLRLLLLIFLCGFLGFLGVWGFRENQRSKLNPQFRQTVIINSSSILVISFNPQEDSLTVVSIPDDSFVELTHGFGSYRLSQAWMIGKREGMGGRLLAETVQEVLGVPVDGWLGTRRSERWEVGGGKNEFNKQKNNLTSWKNFLNPSKIINFYKTTETNLSFFDLFNIWWKVKNTRDDKIDYINLTDSAAVSDLILADKSKAKTINQNLLDSEIKNKFIDSGIEKENFMVEVVNASQKVGLGNRAGRMIGNLGVWIIDITSNQETLNTCQILTTAKAFNSLTVQRISQIFNCLKSSDLQDGRADVQVMVGSDYEKRLYSR